MSRLIRLAIPVSDDRGLDSFIFEHFGRAPYFVIVDIRGNEILNIKSVKNSFSRIKIFLLVKFIFYR